MIERKVVAEKLREYMIQEYITNNLRRIGHSSTKLQKTPLGEKIVVSASRPGLVVGRKGQSIKKLTSDLKKKFNLENPQIEISEVENINLDANIIAEKISSSLERFGSTRFKGLGHKIMSDVMGAGALGVEILISGKVPSARAKRWRFYQGYLKKCGDIATSYVRTAYASANLKSGTIGIQVRIMPPDIKLPDKVELLKEPQIVVEEVALDDKEEKSDKKTGAKKKSGKGQEETKKEGKEEKIKENKEEKKKPAKRARKKSGAEAGKEKTESKEEKGEIVEE